MQRVKGQYFIQPIAVGQFMLVNCSTNLEESLSHQSSRKHRIRRIFMPTFGFVRIYFLLGILIYANFFFCRRVSNSSKTPEDSGSPNLDSATKDHKIAANPMPQGLS